jgi:hypothetical protein
LNGGCSIQRQWQWTTDKQWQGNDGDTSGGEWRWWASAFDSSDGRSWVLVFDGGNGQQLWQQWTIETMFNGSGGGGI